MIQKLSDEIGGAPIGYIEYNDKQNYPHVDFIVVVNGRPLDRRAITRYLTTKRTFFIPFSSETTDLYNEYVVSPTAALHYFQLALMELGRYLSIFLAK